MKPSALILGGGLMGLATARELASRGYLVTLWEAGSLGGDASRASAGMIGPQSEALEDDAYFEGTLQSRDLWPEFARSLGEETQIDFGFRPCGAWHLAFGASYEKRLDAKYLWQKRRAGKLKRLERAELSERYPYFHPRVSSAFEAEGDYVVDNEALVEALRISCEARGVLLQKGWAARSFIIEGGQVKGASCALGEARADVTVLASGAWSSSLLKGLKGDLAYRGPSTHPVKGQMLSFVVPDELMPPLPIHAENIYLVPRGDGRLLCGATVETVGFDKRLTGEGIEYLLQGAFETVPDLRRCEVDKVWAGLRPGSSDGWPMIGWAAPGLLLNTGHYRRGILFAPLSCQAAADLAQGKPAPPAAQVFAPQAEGRGGRAAQAPAQA